MNNKICLLVLTLLLTSMAASSGMHSALAFSPQKGDDFSYHEVQTISNGFGDYTGYTDQTVTDGNEGIGSVTASTVSAGYEYVWQYTSNQEPSQSGNQSGVYTFSGMTFAYLNGTDDQLGYTNPTVWFAMNNSLPVGATFFLLDTQMTVQSRNYSYYLPSLAKDVSAISAQGSGTYQRDDSYGTFTASYTWTAYFDPASGYILGYGYTEQDSNSSGDGFSYSDNLYVTTTSYDLTVLTGSVASMSSTSNTLTTYTATTITQSNSFPTQTDIIIIVILIFLLILVAVGVSRRGRGRLPEHSSSESAGPIHLTPDQPQQIVIKEVAKKTCKYCGALIPTTATTCPKCGGPNV